MRKLQQVKKFVANLSLAASAVLLSVVSLAMFVNVLDRFIFKMGLMWVETFSRYGLIWSVFLASNVLIYRNELMRVDFLDNLLPAKFKSVREKVYTLAFVLMLAILIYYGGDRPSPTSGSSRSACRSTSSGCTSAFPSAQL